MSEWFLLASRPFVERLIVNFVSGLCTRVTLCTRDPALNPSLPIFCPRGPWVLMETDKNQASQDFHWEGESGSSQGCLLHTRFDVEFNGLLPDWSLSKHKFLKNTGNILAILCFGCYTRMTCVIKVKAMDIKFTSQQELKFFKREVQFF